MKSLKNRKAQSGESAESVRALLPSDMKKLWQLCKKGGKAGAQQYVSISLLFLIFKGNAYTQIGYTQCIYIWSYLCLLRADEALKINIEHIEFAEEEYQSVTLTLDFRKKHQGGGM